MTITIYGKGWSLDNHDFSLDAYPRYAINEAALVAPDSTCVVQDDMACERVEMAWRKREAPKSLMRYIVPEGSAALRVLEGLEVGADRYEVWPYIKAATLPWFLWCLAHRGVNDIVLVACDSYFSMPVPASAQTGTKSPYSARVEEAAGSRLKRGFGHDYDKINEQIRQICYWFQLRVTNGSMFDRSE